MNWRGLVFAGISAAIPLAGFVTFVVFDRWYRQTQTSPDHSALSYTTVFLGLSLFFLIVSAVAPFVIVKYLYRR
jgi:hypothetical protein